MVLGDRRRRRVLDHARRLRDGGARGRRERCHCPGRTAEPALPGQHLRNASRSKCSQSVFVWQAGNDYLVGFQGELEPGAQPELTVRASAVGIIAEVEQAIGQGLVQANMRGALLAKLQAAQTAIERGQKATAIAQLNQFISMVQGEAGKKVDAGLAGRLASLAQDLIGRL